ncbi:MAG: hypothetical protein RBT11_06915 [Desulfobacterales bacterium]|jgi:hypothetical protein|nr:hypothetical protein [Desulfobacterales bacterium]
MEMQISFSKQENEALPLFRQRLSSAESIEDVKKFFVYTSKEILEDIFSNQLEVNYEDVALMTEEAPYYKISAGLNASETFKSVWNNSDLQHVVSRFAKTAMKRCKHLDKHPEKTESKIRM